MTLQEAIDRCKAQSLEHECSQHVNAMVRLHDRGNELVPVIAYGVSDWFSSEATVYSFHNGEGRIL